MKMRAIWELVETTIIPILTYESEGWKLTKGEYEQLQTIFNKALKDILKLPQGTPTQILLGETGFQPINLIINKKRLMQSNRIEQMDENKLIKIITGRRNNQWTEETKEIIEKYNVQHEITGKKEPLKRTIQEKNKALHEEMIEMEAQNKSKIKHWTEMKEKVTSGKRPEYMNRLSRNECSAIIRARSRMIPVKKNQQNQHQNMTCRFCKDQNSTETQHRRVQSNGRPNTTQN